jgi:exopolyphosphatase/guanosine-5'-triphosphate,3'-diphosphate pyrophosphatase
LARYAAIDIGTNTVRLLVADAEETTTYRTVHEEHVITRLGEQLQETGLLEPVAMGRTLQVLRQFAHTAKNLAAEEIVAVATSAAREAENRAEFLDRALSEVGLELQIISGEEEARLTAIGVLHALGPDYPNMLIVDIGGGSTEFTAIAHGKIIRHTSLPIGVVKLTEAHLKSDPPSGDELEVAAASIRETLQQVPPSLQHPPGATLVGTAGTPTTLAAIDLGLEKYDGARVTGHRLSRARIRELLDYLCSLPLGERRHIVGLEPARADVILAGTVLTREIMNLFAFHELTLSDGGLREGLLLHHLTHREGGAETLGKTLG